MIAAKRRKRRPRTFRVIDIGSGRVKGPVKCTLWPVRKPRRRLASAMA